MKKIFSSGLTSNNQERSKKQVTTLTAIQKMDLGLASKGGPGSGVYERHGTKDKDGFTAAQNKAFAAMDGHNKAITKGLIADGFSPGNGDSLVEISVEEGTPAYDKAFDAAESMLTEAGYIRSEGGGDGLYEYLHKDNEDDRLELSWDGESDVENEVLLEIRRFLG